MNSRFEKNIQEYSSNEEIEKMEISDILVVLDNTTRLCQNILDKKEQASNLSILALNKIITRCSCRLLKFSDDFFQSSFGSDK